MAHKKKEKCNTCFKILQASKRSSHNIRRGENVTDPKLVGIAVLGTLGLAVVFGALSSVRTTPASAGGASFAQRPPGFIGG
jgi:hypothetical protein